jgi:6-phosphogluconolactonase
MLHDIRIYEDSTALALAAAEWVVASSKASIETKGRFSLSLSGGGTPRLLYATLASPGFIGRIDWPNLDLFWGDERCVPPDHPDSDYRMAREALLDHLSPNHFPRTYRIPAEINPTDAADSYQSLLRGYFGPAPATTFDLLLLGMGEDGHTASLFPGTAAVHETERWVVSHYVPKLSAWRVTLAPTVLNLSSQTLFLVAGAGKQAVLDKVLNGPYQPDLFPSQIIQPLNHRLTWLIDRAASTV